MRLRKLKDAPDGLFVIETDPKGDARGHFMRTYCRETLSQAGLDFTPVQCSESFNRRAGTLRGLHFQRAPAMETKIVRCTQGAVFDVAVDIRPASSTFGCWEAITLSADNGLAFVIPEGFAHGFQTLTDSSVVSYMITPAFRPELAAGLLWCDQDVRVAWPEPPAGGRILSDRDTVLPSLATLKSSL